MNTRATKQRWINPAQGEVEPSLDEFLQFQSPLQVLIICCHKPDHFFL